MLKIDELKTELISRLYSDDLYSSYSNLTKVISRIKLLKDPVFIKPLIDGYRKVRSRNDGSPHVFIECLADYESDLISAFLEEEFKTIPTGMDSIRYYFPLFKKYTYYSEVIENRIVEELKLFFDTQNILLYYPVGREIFEFLEFNNRSEIVFDLIWANLIKNVNASEVITGIIFDDIFKCNSKKTLQQVQAAYNSLIKNTSLETAIALRVESRPELNNLRSVISSQGGDEAKLILLEDTSNYAEISSFRPTRRFSLSKIEVVYYISRTRSNINDKIRAKFGITNVFKSDEAIISQAVDIYDELELINLMIGLREYITNISKLNITLNRSEISKLLPKSKEEDFNKPLNRLYLFFKEKNIPVDTQLIEIKKIYFLTTMLGSHTKSNENKIKIMSDFGLVELYGRRHFSKMHLVILQKYNECLKSLLLSCSW